MLGIWRVTDREKFMSPFGPTYTLFVDGVSRASCAENTRFGYAMAWDQPSGNFLEPARQAIQCLDLGYAEARCLKFVGLDVSEVDRSAFETIDAATLLTLTTIT